jgi:hypothetical protein
MAWRCLFVFWFSSFILFIIYNPSNGEIARQHVGRGKEYMQAFPRDDGMHEIGARV